MITIGHCLVPKGNMPIVDVSGKGLTTLQGYPFPSDITVLYCSNNRLTSLLGCPSSVQEIYCYGNLLLSLVGCPSGVKVLECSNNRLTSLRGCPASVEKLHCLNNRLTSLIDCPPSVRELLYSGNLLLTPYHNSSLQDIHASNRRERAAKKIQRAWKRYWYTPNKEGEAPCAIKSYSRDIVTLLTGTIGQVYTKQ